MCTVASVEASHNEDGKWRAREKRKERGEGRKGGVRKVAEEDPGKLRKRQWLPFPFPWASPQYRGAAKRSSKEEEEKTSEKSHGFPFPFP